MNESRPRRFVSLLTRETLALVLAGGKGTRLGALTRHRVKPAVPFGGKYRLIDFPLSNCVNSGIRRIGVLTQYKAHSLIRHLQQGWGYLKGEFGEFIEILPAQQRVGPQWYRGTADAVYQNLDIIRGHDPRYILVLGGDHVYKMDYGPLLAWHEEHEADVTVACMEVPLEQAKSFGVMHVDDDARVIDFVEKPEHPPGLPGHPDLALASMGIYVFNTEFLTRVLDSDAGDPQSGHDFGHDILPDAVPRARVMAYPFRERSTGRLGYWRDVGSLDSYWAANLELIGIAPEIDLYDEAWPIWTYHPAVPPAKFAIEDGDNPGAAIESLVAGGCIVAGAEVNRSVLSANVRVGRGSRLSEAVVLHDASVDRDCRIRRAVIESRCHIPERTHIGYDAEEDARRFAVSPGGIVVVTPDRLGQDTWQVG